MESLERSRQYGEGEAHRLASLEKEEGGAYERCRFQMQSAGLGRDEGETSGGGHFRMR